ncbi:MAG: aldo/keto reductase [Gammaproteobacteria bacterium]|jgi:aryl-alcohol dehydrogenase-like predicted oxidoreductase
MVSCLGLGTVKLGRNQGVKYPAGFTLPDDDTVVALLSQARALGINLIDTAPAYGTSEERLGNLLTHRHKWIICSKVGEEFKDGNSFFDFSAGHVKRSVERSLRRLNTDYLDIVLVHSDGNDLKIINQTDCLEQLQRLKQAGSIRAFGMSTKTVAGGLTAAELSDVVMVTFNTQATEDAVVIDKASSLHKGVLIKKGLASGHLDALTQADQDPVKASLAFILRKSGVSSVIVGTINASHLAHNVDAAIAATRQGQGRRSENDGAL